MGKEMTEPVLPRDIARLAMHQRGGAKGVNKAVKYALILNKQICQEKGSGPGDLRDSSGMRIRESYFVSGECWTVGIHRSYHLREEESIERDENINKRSR